MYTYPIQIPSRIPIQTPRRSNYNNNYMLVPRGIAIPCITPQATSSAWYRCQSAPQHCEMSRRPTHCMCS